MFVLKDKKTQEILMVGTHKSVCRYYAVERELLRETDEYRYKALNHGTKDKIYSQECDHLYEIIEVANYDKTTVYYCASHIAKKISKKS